MNSNRNASDHGAACEAIEREVLLTGIGGQGVQLAARILALAATLEDREVMSLGTYGGTMRGGNTDATVVIANETISAPPLVSRAWSALVFHPRHFAPLVSKLRPHGIVMADSDLLEGALPAAPCPAIEIPASTLAREAGTPRAAALVLLGAFAKATGLVRDDSLERALEQALPSYRRDTLDTNRRALETGRDAVDALAIPAWRAEAA